MSQRRKLGISVLCWAGLLTICCADRAPAQPSNVGFYSGTCTVAISADTPRYRVTGRVVDVLTAAPLANATVTLTSVCLAAADRRQSAWSAKATSDEKGNFSFDDAPAISASLTATLDGYRQEAMSLDSPMGMYTIAANMSPITVRLAASPSISGVVRGADGDPLANVTVTLGVFQPSQGTRSASLFGVVQTKADGSYGFSPLWPGRFSLTAYIWHGGHEPQRDARGRYVGYVPARYPNTPPAGADSYLELVPGQQARVDFEFRSEALHHVTGTADGGDIWPPIVQAFDSRGSNVYFARMTGNRCCGFETWLPSGPFRLEAMTSGGAEQRGMISIEVRDSDLQGITIPLEPSSRAGLEIPITITPAPPEKSDLLSKFWYVQLIGLTSEGGGNMSTQAGWMKPAGTLRTESVSVPSGSYNVVLPPAGNTYAQSITRGGIDLRREPMVVRPGAAQEAIRIVIADGAAVEGFARGGGNPVRASVYAVPEQPDGKLVQSTTSGPDGKFRIEGLAPAPYLFFASDTFFQVDARIASEIDEKWRKVGQRLTPEVGRTASLDLVVSH